jgi:hypothetical protein
LIAPILASLAAILALLYLDALRRLARARRERDAHRDRYDAKRDQVRLLKSSLHEAIRLLVARGKRLLLVESVAERHGKAAREWARLYREADGRLEELAAGRPSPPVLPFALPTDHPRDA